RKRSFGPPAGTGGGLGVSLTTEGATRSLLAAATRKELTDLFGGNVGFDEPLAPLTSWKVGGPADALVTVEDERGLADLLRLCVRRRLPWWVVGAGSNVLIGDGGVRGIVVRLTGTFNDVTVNVDDRAVIVAAGGAANVALVTAKAASAGASGVDSLAGIPGTIGGSLRMNAGTDREFGDFVSAVWVQSPSRPEPHQVGVAYCYRHSTLDRDAVVSRVELKFEREQSERVRRELQARLVRRKRTQPLALPNAGSCFRNPPGEKAARLIESVGAKGWREGGAEVSTLHGNFINNLGEATAKDVATLLARVRREVYQRCGVELQLEVHLVGVFIDAA
ncbi:MAG: UDP-N-acetylmuramate dehydrogenase, partial [Candidatus Eremiobacteraeota bacterium]|nr:UDP-N-acetylmuramate dehydrogenase [Candidatus Eremiobacteraeota bacterium]